MLVSGPQKYLDSSGTKLRGDSFVDLMGRNSSKKSYEEKSKLRQSSVQRSMQNLLNPKTDERSQQIDKLNG